MSFFSQEQMFQIVKSFKESKFQEVKVPTMELPTMEPSAYGRSAP